MTSCVHLREFQFEADYEPLYKLWLSIETGMQAGPSDSRHEIQKKLQRDPDLFLIAELDAQIIGSVIGGYDGRRGMIYHLAVHETHRHQGIGAALLTEVEKRLQAKGCIKIYLLVLDDNETAIRFYNEHGWKPQPHDLVFSKEFK